MMEVDGTMALWTTLLGWHYYNIVWGLLVASGIAFIPIAGMVIDHLIEARSRGSIMSQRGDGIFSGIEVQIIVIIMVILLAVRPSGTATLSSASFKYTPDDTIYSDDTAVRTIDNTNTNLDGVTYSRDYNIAQGSVPIPPAWFVVLQASSGFSFSGSHNRSRSEVNRRGL